MWIGAMVRLLAGSWVQLSVSAGNGWPHNALRHHRLMPVSCHFRDCKSAAGHESDSCKRRYNKYPDLLPFKLRKHLLSKCFFSGIVYDYNSELFAYNLYFAAELMCDYM